MLDPEEESKLSRKCCKHATTSQVAPLQLGASCHLCLHPPVCLAGRMSVCLCCVLSATDTRICGCPLQVKVLEGAQPSTTMKSQAGLGGGSLAATQQRGLATPGSPTQQTTKGFNKSGKSTTARPMGATLPVSLLLRVAYSGLHLSISYCCSLSCHLCLLFGHGPAMSLRLS